MELIDSSSRINSDLPFEQLLEELIKSMWYNSINNRQLLDIKPKEQNAQRIKMQTKNSENYHFLMIPQKVKERQLRKQQLMRQGLTGIKPKDQWIII